MIAWLRDTVHNALFSRRTFEFFQRLRINITKNHHYSPIPDMRSLVARKIWEQETELPGVNLREHEQLQRIGQIVAQYRDECDFPLEPTSVTHEYYMRNDTYSWLCAVLYHSLIRHYKPRKIIELGAGRSTYLAARAVCMNKAGGTDTELIAVDPFPNGVLQKGFPGLSRVVPQRAEELSLDFLSDLDDGDILFIDSTHTVKIGGDVTFLFLEVLPRLRSGVLVQVHDVFWPRHYPRRFVQESHFFWGEQYLLQAFMAFNDHFEIMWSGNFMMERHSEKVRRIFGLPSGISDEGTMLKCGLQYSSSSFWMRRNKD